MLNWIGHEKNAVFFFLIIWIVYSLALWLFGLNFFFTDTLFPFDCFFFTIFFFSSVLTTIYSILYNVQFKLSYVSIGNAIKWKSMEYYNLKMEKLFCSNRNVKKVIRNEHKTDKIKLNVARCGKLYLSVYVFECNALIFVYSRMKTHEKGKLEWKKKHAYRHTVRHVFLCLYHSPSFSYIITLSHHMYANISTCFLIA